jgi:hypothetical protein
VEGLKTSRVHRKLDTRLKILGFEIMDLLAIMMLAAVNNLILGRLKFAPVFVIVIPAILAAVLYIVKRDKPENYLLHLLRYLSSPGLYSAGLTNQKLEEKRRNLIAKV